MQGDLQWGEGETLCEEANQSYELFPYHVKARY